MKWNSEEELYLKSTYSTRIALGEIAKKLGRTVRSIQRKAAEMGISRPRKIFDAEKLKVRAKKANDKFYENNSKDIYARKKLRRHAMKKDIVSIMGGKCSKCGYNKCITALEFHHEEGEKDSCLTDMIKNCSKQKVLKEIEKCVLLCANCHRETHS